MTNLLRGSSREYSGGVITPTSHISHLMLGCHPGSLSPLVRKCPTCNCRSRSCPTSCSATTIRSSRWSKDYSTAAWRRSHLRMRCHNRSRSCPTSCSATTIRSSRRSENYSTATWRRSHLRMRRHNNDTGFWSSSSTIVGRKMTHCTDDGSRNYQR